MLSINRIVYDERLQAFFNPFDSVYFIRSICKRVNVENKRALLNNKLRLRRVTDELSVVSV